MAPSGLGATAPEEDEEDDYMNMTFEDPSSTTTESSLQRTQRLKRESRARGIIKSKEERAEEEAAAREKALSTSMLDDPRAKKSKGFAMMSKMGFTGGGLGKKTEDGGSGRTEPIKVNIKEDRGGIGLDSEKKRKLQEVAEEQGFNKAARVLDPDEYRDRVRKEREEARMEKQFHAAQRMAERMDEENGVEKPDEEEQKGREEAEDEGNANGTSEKMQRSMSSRPLKSIPVLYRGLVRHREEQERDRRMRYDLEQSLSRLPTYEDEHEDEDDKRALGRTSTKADIYVTAEDLDEEDPELDAFNETGIEEKLNRVLTYLREKHRYCFWCKMGYPDAEMEGCPGLTEEEHD